MSEKTIERNLGSDAYTLICDALRGRYEKKKFAWTGSKAYLPPSHEYTIIGFNGERRFWGFFEVRDETTQEMKNVFYDFLCKFREILADPKQESSQRQSKCTKNTGSVINFLINSQKFISIRKYFVQPILLL